MCWLRQGRKSAKSTCGPNNHSAEKNGLVLLKLLGVRALTSDERGEKGVCCRPSNNGAGYDTAHLPFRVVPFISSERERKRAEIVTFIRSTVYATPPSDLSFRMVPDHFGLTSLFEC